jgi:molecular chaperone DnaK
MNSDAASAALSEPTRPDARPHVGARTAVVAAAPPPPSIESSGSPWEQTMLAPPSSPESEPLFANESPRLPPPEPPLFANEMPPLPPPPAAPIASGPRLTASSLGFNAVQPPGPSAPFSYRPPPGSSVIPPGGPPALPLLLDVTPHTLGIETVGGMCESVIQRNATIPVEQSREFATSYDGQEAVRIRIAQGESRRFGENQLLGELELSGITRAGRGEVTIAVTFELDADGTLHVRAREAATGRETQTRVMLLTMPSAQDAASMAQRQRIQA